MHISSSKKSNKPAVTADNKTKVFNALMQDPEIQLGNLDSTGIQNIYFNSKLIGKVNPKSHDISIDTSVYTKLPADISASVTVKKGAAKKKKKEKASKKSKKIKSTQKYASLEELEDAIKEALDDEVCIDIVAAAYSNDGVFEDDYFTPSDDFFESIIANYEAKEVALKFFNGEDLDSKGPANPNREYFRFDGYANIESTDYPGDIYMDTLDVDIVDYIMEHLEDVEYPEKIQKLIDAYLDNMEE